MIVSKIIQNFDEFYSYPLRYLVPLGPRFKEGKKATPPKKNKQCVRWLNPVGLRTWSLHNTSPANHPKRVIQ